MADMAAQERYPIPTVGALVRGPSGRILLVRTTKWRGAWGVPGGKVRWGEPLEEALRREVREEVGLELTRIRWALVQEAVEDPAFYRRAHFILLNYFAETDREAVRPNEEIAEWAWVAPERALDYPLNRYTRVLIERYLEERDG